MHGVINKLGSLSATLYYSIIEILGSNLRAAIINMNSCVL